MTPGNPSFLCSPSWDTGVVLVAGPVLLEALGKASAPPLWGYLSCVGYFKALCSQIQSLFRVSNRTGKRPSYYSFISLTKHLFKLTSIKPQALDFPSSPVFKTLSFHCRTAQIQCLVREDPTCHGLFPPPSPKTPQVFPE